MATFNTSTTHPTVIAKLAIDVKWSISLKMVRSIRPKHVFYIGLHDELEKARHR